MSKREELENKREKLEKEIIVEKSYINFVLLY